METIERHVRSWIATEKDADVDGVVSSGFTRCHWNLTKLAPLVLSSGQSTLLDVVKALGEYLTAEDDSLRSKGLWSQSFWYFS